MTKREELAAAAYKAYFGDDWPEDAGPFVRETWFRVADAILDVLREPTGGMVTAGEDGLDAGVIEVGGHLEIYGATATRGCWQAMIDHIKQEGR